MFANAAVCGSDHNDHEIAFCLTWMASTHYELLQSSGQMIPSGIKPIWLACDACALAASWFVLGPYEHWRTDEPIGGRARSVGIEVFSLLRLDSKAFR